MSGSNDIYRPSLGVMTLAHARPQYLAAIGRCLGQMELPVVWHIALNEPTSAVITAVQEVLPKLERNVTAAVFEAPFTPLGRTERFMELRQWQLERLPWTDYGVIWDDDQMPADPAGTLALLNLTPDLVYATKVFFWDNDETVATHFPVHRSVFYFLRLKGDAFDLKRTLHAPAKIHDSARVIEELPGGLLDYGYMTREDRERCWRDYKRVGKIDAATLPLIMEPTLQHWPGPYPLRSTLLQKAGVPVGEIHDDDDDE